MLGGEFLDSVKRFDKACLDLMKTAVDAEELDVPTTVPLDSMLRNGYVASFPHHVQLACCVHPEMGSIEKVAGLTDSRDAELFLSERMLSPPGAVLSPTVCYHVFEALANAQIAAGGRAITAFGKCHRNEGANTASLSRLQTFRMREWVFFGDAEDVKTRREKGIETFEKAFRDWGFKFRLLTATDPFFAVGGHRRRPYQAAMDLNYDLQVWLPWSESWISVCSFNLHQSSLTTNYDIGLAGGGTAWSACIGIGYERLVYATYAQFGMDRTEWRCFGDGDRAHSFVEY